MKLNRLALSDIQKLLRYDAEVGEFYWVVSPAKNVKAGTRAGGSRGKNGHRYITVLGVSYTAQRLARFMHHGSEPEFRLAFRDGNGSNYRVDNLVMERGLTGHEHHTKEDRAIYQKAYRSTRREQFVADHRKRKYGLDLADYAAMVTEQNNCCAICERPEVGTRGGKVKALAVDHNHSTGAVRGLLCEACNKAIGLLDENRDTLLAAVKYLDKHSNGANVVPLVKKA